MKKRVRKKIHKEYLEHVTLNISVSSPWRKVLFGSAYGEYVFINKNVSIPISKSIKSLFERYNLKYVVHKVHVCPEQFDEGMVIFEFSPEEFRQVKRYSGNNPGVL
jgi:hypothetical protein